MTVYSPLFINAINEKTDHDHYLLFHSENDRRIPMFFNELFCECFDPSINSTDIIMHLFYTIMAELINVYEDDLTRGLLLTQQRCDSYAALYGTEFQNMYTGICR